jgi:hypothetical protein
MGILGILFVLRGVVGIVLRRLVKRELNTIYMTYVCSLVKLLLPKMPVLHILNGLVCSFDGVIEYVLESLKRGVHFLLSKFTCTDRSGYDLENRDFLE